VLSTDQRVNYTSLDLGFPLNFKPMKGEDYEDQSLQFPRIGQAKIDGHRGVMNQQNQLFTPKLKPVINRYVHSFFSSLAPAGLGLDGELTIGPPNDPDVYKWTDGPLRTQAGTPDFTFWVFDAWNLSDGYMDRYEQLKELDVKCVFPEAIRLVPSTLLKNMSDLDIFTEKCLSEGFEGIMTRSLTGPYKYGRSTVKEGFLLKHKPFRDDEAEIVSVYPAHQNNNVGVIDVTGRLTRTSHKQNLVQKDMIGGFVGKVLTGPFEGVITNIGPGCMSHIDRMRLYQEDLIGKVITFKHMRHIGGYTKPRQGRFWRFRE